VQTIGVFGVAREDLLVDGLRPRQIANLVVLHRLLKLRLQMRRQRLRDSLLLGIVTKLQSHQQDLTCSERSKYA
jgi:hypothetical protein